MATEGGYPDPMRQDILDLVRRYWPPPSLYGVKAAEEEFVPGKSLIPYSGPTWNEEELAEAIQALLEGQWLVSGERVREFERAFSKKVGQEYTLMVNSGSSANLLMVSALRSKRLFGFSEVGVITPVSGFPTTVAPILQNGFKPVFVDVELGSLNLDLEQVEARLKDTPNVKALMFAHTLGNPPDMDRVLDLCRRYDLVFLEDNCDSLGSTWGGAPLGSFGLLSSCSFYPAHHLTTGEGGAVSTSKPEIEKILRSLAWWGRDCYCVGNANLLENGTCKKRFNNWLPVLPDLVVDHKYVYSEIGYNLKPLDLQGAIGLAQLRKYDWIHRRRKEVAESYRSFFLQYPDLFHLPEAHPKSDVSWFHFAVTIATDRFSRDELIRFLESRRIQTRNFFAGNILCHPAFEHLGDFNDYPNALRGARSSFLLGVSPNLREDQIEYVKSSVREFIETHGAPGASAA